jgi:thymidylate kinase
MGSHSIKRISFSGIDGAGKSTQIDALRRFLQDQGIPQGLFTFWDDVVVLPQLRESLSFKVFKGDRGVGSPDRPITRRDKNVSSWPVVAFRFFVYLLDAMRLRLMSIKPTDGEAGVVIFDRYIYDELANLPLDRRAVRAYVRLVLKLVPRPDIAFLVDADPEAAYLRKPEYPLEFVRRNRETYLRLAGLTGMTVLPAMPIEITAATIETMVSESCVQKEPRSPNQEVLCPVPVESIKTSVS